jgi:hypothetical protein
MSKEVQEQLEAAISLRMDPVIKVLAKVLESHQVDEKEIVPIRRRAFFAAMEEMARLGFTPGDFEELMTYLTDEHEWLSRCIGLREVMELRRQVQCQLVLSFLREPLPDDINEITQELVDGLDRDNVDQYWTALDE